MTAATSERATLASLRPGDPIDGVFACGDLVHVKGRVDRFRDELQADLRADSLPGRRFGSPGALALYRLNSLDAGVKGALERGLGQ